MKQGIYDIPMADYIADPCDEPALSKGVVLNLVERSPLHAWTEHPRFGNRRSESSRADIGSAAHAGLLGGDKALAFIDARDWRTKLAKEARDMHRAEGKIPLLEKLRKPLTKMVGVARPALESLGIGMSEQTLIWQDGGVWCKSRPDWIRDDFDIVVDYKTTENADPASWARWTLMAGGYDIQGALCLRALDIIKGERQRQFLFLIQEINEPYAISWVGISPDLEELAMRKINRAIPLWRECLAADNWPGYQEDVYWADAPSWAMWDTEARELREKGSGNDHRVSTCEASSLILSDRP